MERKVISEEAEPLWYRERKFFNFSKYLLDMTDIRQWSKSEKYESVKKCLVFSIYKHSTATLLWQPALPTTNLGKW